MGLDGRKTAKTWTGALAEHAWMVVEENIFSSFPIVEILPMRGRSSGTIKLIQSNAAALCSIQGHVGVISHASFP